MPARRLRGRLKDLAFASKPSELHKKTSAEENSGMKRILLLFVVLHLTSVVVTFGQTVEQTLAKKKAATSGELFETISRMDAAVFAAFNAHDVERLMTMFTDDLEFYDDGSGGPKSRRECADDFSKVFARVPGLQRELLRETLEVYPLQGYGAIEVGEHRFCHQENGKADCGVTKFSMVWRKNGEIWQLARVLSYAH